MNKNFRLAAGLTVFLCMTCSAPVEKSNSAEKQPVDFVNPYMGNISHLLVPTFPTVHLPNSFMRVYPERRDYTEIRITGLPIVVTGHRRSSAFNLSPFQGDENDLKPVIEFSYDQEKLTPYSYSVYLDDQQIQVDFGLSHQSAVYHLQFEQDAPAFLILNTRQGGLSWDGESISGYQIIGNNTRVYLYLVPDEMPQLVSALNDGALFESSMAEGQNACLVLKYPKGTRTLDLRYGISFIDEAPVSYTHLTLPTTPYV